MTNETHDIIESLAESVGIDPLAVRHAAEGVIALIERDNGLSLLAECSQKDQSEIVAAYLQSWLRIQERMREWAHMHPEQLNATVLREIHERELSEVPA